MVEEWNRHVRWLQDALEDVGGESGYGSTSMQGVMRTDSTTPCALDLLASTDALDMSSNAVA